MSEFDQPEMINESSMFSHKIPSYSLLGRNGGSPSQIFLSVWVDIDVRTTVQRCPLWLLLEEPHGNNVLLNGQLLRH